MKNNTHGFTIVELLIVIVIIGTIATIVIGVFQGSQQKANNNQTLAIVNQYIKATTQYAADNNKYPEPSPGGVGWSCIGTGYPSSTCFNTAGPPCNGIGPLTSQPWYNDAVKVYMQNKTPPTSLQVIPCSGGSYVGGAFLSNWPVAGQGGIFYLLKDVSCGTPGGLPSIRWFAFDTVYSACYVILPSV